MEEIRITIDGEQVTVLKAVYGKVKVRFNDGTVKVVNRSQVVGKIPKKTASVVLGEYVSQGSLLSPSPPKSALKSAYRFAVGLVMLITFKLSVIAPYLLGYWLFDSEAAAVLFFLFFAGMSAWLCARLFKLLLGDKFFDN